MATTTDTQTATREPSYLKRYLGLGGGVALEWFDWQIYGLMAVFLAPHFFPSEDRIVSTLSALAVFALGFVVRPLSGAILGPLTDRIGHKVILLYSIGAMAVCSLVIGLLPGYDTLGVAAGIIVLIARIIQGLSTGIEQPAANAAALELARPGKAGFFAGVVNGAFNQGGNLLAALVAFLTSLILGGEIMNDWGWRVPFIIGGLAGFLVLLVRRSLPDTGAAVATNVKHTSTKEVWKDIWRYRFAVLTIVFVVGGTMIANYTWTTGLPNLANGTFTENPTPVFALTVALMALMVISGPIVGWLADKYGSSRIYLTLRILLVPTYFVMLAYSEPGLDKLALVMLGGGLIVAFNQTLFNYITATLMPPQIRTTGIALGYGIAVAVFGGTASYILVWSQSVGGTWIFALYGALIATLSIVFYAAARQKGYVYTETNAPENAAQQ